MGSNRVLLILGFLRLQRCVQGVERWVQALPLGLLVLIPFSGYCVLELPLGNTIFPCRYDHRRISHRKDQGELRGSPSSRGIPDAAPTGRMDRAIEASAIAAEASAIHPELGVCTPTTGTRKEPARCEPGGGPA